MLSNLKARKDREDGFTLIELMVVVLIIAILIAIAIPTFLGARERAQNRAAQSSLRNALTAAKTLYTDTNSYSAALSVAGGGSIDSAETSLDFVAAGVDSTGPKEVSVAISDVVVGDQQVWAAAALSRSGECYWIMDTMTGAGSGTTYGSDPTGAACSGTDALAAAGDEW